MQPFAPLIMIIDDSATVRKIVEVALKREGYRVISFVDGVEALRWLLAASEVPALLFLDIHLPKMTGYEVARYLKSKAKFANIQIVMLTRRSGVVDRLKAGVRRCPALYDQTLYRCRPCSDGAGLYGCACGNGVINGLL